MSRFTIVNLPLLLIVFLASCSLTLAQDWNPLPANQTLLYQYPGNTQSLQYSIMAAKCDSVVAEGQDSVHYLYRIDRAAFPGETAVGCNNWTREPDYVLNQDHYFGQKMVRRPDGDCHFISSSADSFLLKSHAPQGATWMWDDTTTATISAITATTVFGQADSVKVIALSNGNTLRLSKSHGLIAAYAFFSADYINSNNPQFKLWGIPELALGRKLPGFDGVFGHQVGDQFGYKKKHSSYPFGGYTTTYTVNLKILSAIPGSDTSYLARIKVAYDYVGAQGGNQHQGYPLKDTVLSFPRVQYQNLESLPFQHHQIGMFGYYPWVQAGVHLWEADTNRVMLTFATWLDHDTCSQIVFFTSAHTEEKYMTGVGLWDSFENGDDYDRRYYKTCFTTAAGSYDNCPDLDSLANSAPDPDPMHEVDFLSYPNPAHDLLHVDFHNRLATQSHTISIYSPIGTLVSKHVVPKGTNNFTVDVEELVPAMYIMKIEQNGRAPIVRKFLVAH